MTAVRRSLAGILATVLALAGTGCGGEGAPRLAPKAVADGLVPSKVQQQFEFHETSLDVKGTFAEAGPDSLASDGRVWELRKADRLVGILQVTTLLPEVDIKDKDQRDTIVKQLLPTARDRLDVGDVAVWSSSAKGKSSYVWFGAGMFSLFTVKPGSQDALDPERALQDVLNHMVAAPSWEFVYFDD